MGGRGPSTVCDMSTLSSLPAWAPALPAVDPRPELRRAADRAAEAVALVRRTADVPWRGAASEGYRDLVVEAVSTLYRAGIAGDQAVGAAARYLQTVDAANAQASLR